jgi:ribosome-binding protein aMBF1 (putative translation factor)
MVCVLTHALSGKRRIRSKFTRRPYQPGPEFNAIGATLRRMRNSRDWSQEDLAGRCQRRGWDIDRVIVAKIESRFRAVSDWELLKLCEIVGVAPNEMLGWKPPT